MSWEVKGFAKLINQNGNFFAHSLISFRRTGHSACRMAARKYPTAELTRSDAENVAEQMAEKHASASHEGVRCSYQ